MTVRFADDTLSPDVDIGKVPSNYASRLDHCL